MEKKGTARSYASFVKRRSVLNMSEAAYKPSCNSRSVNGVNMLTLFEVYKTLLVNCKIAWRKSPLCYRFEI